MLQEGADADLVVVDPEARAAVDADYYEGWIRDWSIYEGWQFQGMPQCTVVRGEVVAHRSEIVGSPGHGTYVGAATAATETA